MPDHHTVSTAARELSDRLGERVRPGDISTLFYQRELRDDLCPVVAGRRIIPRDYLPLIESALRRRGYINPAKRGTSHAS